MTDRQLQIQRAILASATAYVTAPHGSGARAILFNRMHQLLSLRAQEGDRDNLSAGDDLGGVVVAAARVCGMLGPSAPGLGDPEFYLRTALNRYFAGQSQRLAEALGQVAA